MPKKPKKVYFFGTCLMDVLYPDAGMDAMELLQEQGVEVIFPQDQTCCGQPAFNSGYRDEALRVARHQLQLFAEDIPIVVPSGSCAGMMKHQYAELFAGEPEEAQAREFSARIHEFTEFLLDVLRVHLEDLGEPERVAIHSSCAARREMGVADKIERLVEQLDNVEIVYQDHKAECCGFGGAFAVKQPEISAAMVADKTAALIATDAEEFVSQDCGCLMNINGALESQGQTLNGKHIATFLRERTRDESAD